MKAFVLSHLNPQLSELTTARPAVGGYCTPLSWYNGVFVLAVLHFDSVIVHSGYANRLFRISDKHSTQVHHLWLLLYLDELQLNWTHEVTFVLFITHLCLNVQKGIFVSILQFSTFMSKVSNYRELV